MQCPRHLWTAINDKEKIPEYDETTKWTFEQGYLVQEYAQKWFPTGIEISTEDFNKNLEESKKLLKKGKPLFEAAFKIEVSENNYIYSRGDILMPVGDKWDIVEVKSASKTKPENIQDVSFQKYVCEKAGLKIRKCFLMHINGDYVKKGEIDHKKLMAMDDITEEIEEEIIGIGERIDNLFKIMKSKECPKVAIGTHCRRPYECPLSSCWDFIPSNSVFDLYYGGKKSFELFERDIQLLKDIPKDFNLTRKQQQIQIKCAKTNKPHIDNEEINKFLDKLKYPLYYLDFETISTAIPLFDKSHPYQQVPFQYSLHIVEKKGDEPKHISFLAKSDDDPRHGFMKSLQENLGDKGSIVVYNESFEKSVFKKLEMLYPKEKQWIEDILKRVIDLLTPFRNFDYYHPKQKGSASIKAVMPALIPKLPKGIKNYSEMEIGKGDLASFAFLKMILGESPDKKFEKWEKPNEEDLKKIRQHLEEYCELDTLAEVLIVGALGENLNMRGIKG